MLDSGETDDPVMKEVREAVSKTMGVVREDEAQLYSLLSALPPPTN